MNFRLSVDDDDDIFFLSGFISRQEVWSSQLMLFSVFQVALFLHQKESMEAYVGLGNQWKGF